MLFLLFWVTSAAAFAQTSVSGRVYNEASNTGIAGVAISDQSTVVVTDANGKYQITTTPGRSFIMISMPDGYSGIFYNKISSEVNFPLKKIATKTEFSFIHASDTHISKESENRTDKLRALTESLKPDFVLITGDLVKDALRVPENDAKKLFEMFAAAVKKFPTQVWYVPGNHEIFGIERQTSLVSRDNPLYGKKMFAYYLGPNYYSFNYGGIHFVGLDDIDYEDTWYFGHVDSLQMSWLKQDLASVPAKMPVVTFKHIPFYSGGLSLTPFEEAGGGRTLEREKGVLQFRHVVSNASEAMLLLQTHPYPLSLSGHYHARQIFRYESTGQNTRFEQTGAVVGNGGDGNLTMRSGVVLYKVKNGIIDDGKFIPLD